METILVIDDDVEMRDVLFDLLSLDGYEVLLAADGTSGLERYRNALPDLVITDLQMPNSDGLEVLEGLRTEYVDVPIIVMTGSTDAELTEDVAVETANHILEKPFGVDELLTVLDELLGHEAPNSEGLAQGHQTHIG